MTTIGVFRWGKFLLALGLAAACFLCFALLLIFLPFFFDLAIFKPQIRQTISQSANIDVDFQSVRLDFFPNFAIHVKNFRAINTDEKFKGTELLQTRNLTLKLDISQIFSDKMHAEVLMQEPKLNVLFADSQNNFSALMLRQQIALKDYDSPKDQKLQSSSIATEHRWWMESAIFKKFKGRVILRSLVLENSTILISALDNSNSSKLRLENTHAKISDPGLEREMLTELEALVSIVKSGSSVADPVSLDFKLTTLGKVLLGAEGNFKKVTIDNLVMKMGAGSVDVKGYVDFSQQDILAGLNLQVAQIPIQSLMLLIRPESKQLFGGLLSFAVNLQGQGKSTQMLTNSLVGDGSFTLEQGTINSLSLAEMAQKSLEKKLQASSVLAAAPEIFSAVDKVLREPALRAFIGKNPDLVFLLDMDKIKADFESVKTLKFLSAGEGERRFKKASGEFRLANRKIFFKSKNAGADGELELNGSLGFDSALEGVGSYTASEKVRKTLEEQSRYASLFYDDRGELRVPFALEGSINSPRVLVNSADLEKRFVAKAKLRAEQEIGKKADEALQLFMREKGESARRELQAKAKQELERAKQTLRKQLEKHGGNKEAKKLLQNLLGR